MDRGRLKHGSRLLAGGLEALGPTILVVVLCCALLVSDASAVVFYDLDFGTPPHTVGAPPATGGGAAPRNRVSAINFGTPTVRATFGLLTDQPLEFDSFDNQGDQIQLELTDLPPSSSYRFRCDLMIAAAEPETTTAAQGALTILFDTPTVRTIRFGADGNVVILVGTSSTIDTFAFNRVINLLIDINLASNRWDIFLDGLLTHSGPFNATEVRDVRISTNVVPNPQGVNAAIDNLVISDVTRLILVTHGTANANQNFGVTATAAGFSPGEVHLRHRAGGSNAAFSDVDMTGNGTTFTGSIPAADVTARGVEHFVQASDGFVTIFEPSTAPAVPAFLPVSFTNESLTPLPPPETYILTGLPFVAENSKPEEVLVDDLGSYDISRWRFGHFNPASSTYLEFPDTPALDLGVGFWLIMRDPVAVGAAGTSTNSVEETNITIEPGWNQIANPYLFRVDLAAIDFSGAPNVDQRLVAFEGGGYVDKTVLEPWRGYWMFNDGGANETIGVPGDESSGSPRAAPEQVAELEFAIEASVRQGAAWDRGNVAGVSAAASEAMDAFDRREPPAPPGLASVYFLRDEGGSQHALTADIVPLKGNGACWTLVVDSPGEVSSRLTFAGIDRVSEELTVLLWPVERAGQEIDLRTEERELVVPPGRKSRYHLAVGSADYLARRREAVGSAPPAAVALDFLSRNPFREEIALGLDLPERSDVELRIYDVQGRLVETLVEQSLGAGRHTLLWDGRGSKGGAVSAGTFFADLRVGTTRIHRKLLLLR
jgi:hypothetical protein